MQKDPLEVKLNVMFTVIFFFGGGGARETEGQIMTTQWQSGYSPQNFSYIKDAFYIVFHVYDAFYSSFKCNFTTNFFYILVVIYVNL